MSVKAARSSRRDDVSGLRGQSELTTPQAAPAAAWLVTTAAGPDRLLGPLLASPPADAGVTPLRRSAGAVTADPLGDTPIPENVLTELSRNRGRGGELPAGARDAAGQLLGADLSGVRLHTDAHADGLARSVQSVAFTHGRDIYFSRGSFAPGTPGGAALLGHELAHVAQGAHGASTGGPGRIGRAKDPAEIAADRAGAVIAPVLRRSWHEDHAAGTRTPQSSPAPAEHGGISRQVLRRRISSITTTSADIAAVTGSGPKKKNFLTTLITGSKDSLYKIGVLLDRLATLNDTDAETVNLAALVTLCQHWLQRHRGDGDRVVAGLVEDILAEARRDHSKALAQQRYLDDLKLGETATAAPTPGFRKNGSTGPTPLTQQIGLDMHSRAQHVMGQAKKGEGAKSTPRQKQLAELMRVAGLTDAEVAAIMAYTASDYLYINPAIAKKPTWLDAQQDAIASAHKAKGRAPGHMNQQQMREDAVTHAGVAMQGLAKMPVMKGTVYRGARMNREEFAKEYGLRTQKVYRAFTSSTLDRKVCDLYARGGGERKPRADQTISVKCIFQVDNARDIQLLSDAGGEKEWLLLPGATFKITKIEDDTEQVPGDIVPATSWKVVYLQQVPNAQAAPKKPRTPAPARPQGPDLSSRAAQAVGKLAQGDFMGPPSTTPAGRSMLKLADGQF